VERKTRKLNEKFPEYSQLLIEFVEMGKNPPLFKKSDLERIKRLFSGLIKALDESEEFLKDFANMILTTYFENISIL
jgi:predicted ATP-dependent Lon-type protease